MILNNDDETVLLKSLSLVKQSMALTIGYLSQIENEKRKRKRKRNNRTIINWNETIWMQMLKEV